MAEKKSRFNRFYDFDFFILPSIIKVLTMIWIIIYPIMAVIMWIKWEAIRQGILILILWPIAVRINGEIFMLMFKITENTQKIADKA